MKLRILSLATLALSLAACNPAQPPEAAAPETDAQSTAATTPSPDQAVGTLTHPEERTDTATQRDTTVVDASVVGVRFSNSGDTENHTLGMPVTSFSPTDTIYAEVETTGTANEYKLYTKWIASDGTVLADYGMLVAEAGPSRTVISLSKPDGWPQGTHSIEIAINGQVERTVDFEVR